MAMNDEYQEITKETPFVDQLRGLRFGLGMAAQLKTTVRITRPMVERMLETRALSVIDNVVEELIAILTEVDDPDRIAIDDVNLLWGIKHTNRLDAVWAYCHTWLGESEEADKLWNHLGEKFPEEFPNRNTNTLSGWDQPSYRPVPRHMQYAKEFVDPAGYYEFTFGRRSNMIKFPTIQERILCDLNGKKLKDWPPTSTLKRILDEDPDASTTTGSLPQRSTLLDLGNPEVMPRIPVTTLLKNPPVSEDGLLIDPIHLDSRKTALRLAHPEKLTPGQEFEQSKKENKDGVDVNPIYRELLEKLGDDWTAGEKRDDVIQDPPATYGIMTFESLVQRHLQRVGVSVVISPDNEMTDGKTGKKFPYTLDGLNDLLKQYE
jgi:hypothetical protein